MENLLPGIWRDVLGRLRKLPAQAMVIIRNRERSAHVSLEKRFVLEWSLRFSIRRAGSGRIFRTTLQRGPVIIGAIGIVAGRLLLGLLGPGAKSGYAGPGVLRLASKCDVAQPLLHTVKF